MANTTQYYVRVPEKVVKNFKLKCMEQGRSHSEVARFLLAEYGAGRLNMMATPSAGNPTQNPNLGEMLK